VFQGLRVKSWFIFHTACEVLQNLNKTMIGQIDIGIHPDLDYLSGLTIGLTTLDAEGQLYSANQAYKGDLHGSQVASIICGPFYGDDLPRITEIEAIGIPRLGKTMLCLLRALDAMSATGIRVLCLPVGLNLPTPVFRPFLKALTEQGVLVVAPSGNKGVGTVLAPGSYPEVLTVGALDMAGNVAGYSGRMPEGQEAGRKPDIFARGEFPDPAAPDSGKTIRGTSMACAWVAGRAARIRQKFPEATLEEIRARLGAGPPTPVPQSLQKRYVDSRLKAALRLPDANDRVEGIIMSGYPGENGLEPFEMGQLLREVEAIAGCSPLEVHVFGVEDVVHLCASSRFFGVLLQHEGLFCAQAVDLNLFDL